MVTINKLHIPVVIVVVIVVVILLGLLTYNINTYETITYTGTISNIDKESITLEDGTVLFLHGIQQYDWKIGTKYEITINKYKWAANEISNVRVVEIKS